MIRNREEKIAEIIQIIINSIGNINNLYRNGPSLYFYQRVNTLRMNVASIEEFINDNCNVEILYATLVAWDMDSRGAKMKDFNEFQDNLNFCLDYFLEIEECHNVENPYDNIEHIIQLLETVYTNLCLMKTKGRLVSNSKLLHFLFPKLCIPMDRTNTLKYLYGNTNESINKFVEINKFSFDVINNIENWSQYLDDTWNTSATKLVDNAIIIKRRDG